MPEISIIIPVYNQEPYIEMCLDSILAQSFDDFEVLVVDDGSTDDSAPLIAEYADRDSRVQLITQMNAGVSAARNNGLAHAKGAWICFIDPDDYIAAEYLETLHSVTNTSTSLDIVMSACVAFSDSYSRRQHFFPKSFSVRTDDEKKVLYLQLLDGSYGQPRGFVTAIGVPWGKLYRHELLQQNNLHFDPRLVRMEDNLFNMQAFHDAREIVYLDYSGYYYRMGALDDHTYDNMKRGMYRVAIDTCASLLSQYHLLGDTRLRQAWSDEQVNLYYQELKAVAMFGPHKFGTVQRACWQRACELQDRLERIDVQALSHSAYIKYMILTKRLINWGAALALFRKQTR